MKRYIAQVLGLTDWAAAGGDCQRLPGQLQLSGKSRKRRVVVLRRLIRDSLVILGDQKTNQQGELLGMVELLRAGDLYEYAVLVTQLNEGILGIA